MVEKIIHSMEFSNPYKNPTEKTPEIIQNVENNYKIPRWVYQDLFIDNANSFIEYIHFLDINKIQELYDGLKANEWEVIFLLEVENVIEPLTVFQIFYYLSGRFPLTNSLLIFPHGEAPERKEKLKLKTGVRDV